MTAMTFKVYFLAIQIAVLWWSVMSSWNVAQTGPHMRLGAESAFDFKTPHCNATQYPYVKILKKLKMLIFVPNRHAL